MAGTVQMMQSCESEEARGAPVVAHGTTMKLYVGCTFSATGTAMTCSGKAKSVNAHGTVPSGHNESRGNAPVSCHGSPNLTSPEFVLVARTPPSPCPVSVTISRTIFFRVGTRKLMSRAVQTARPFVRAPILQVPLLFCSVDFPPSWESFRLLDWVSIAEYDGALPKRWRRS